MTPEFISTFCSTFCKPIAAIAVAGLTYIADTLVQEIPGVPSWVSALGLPIAFLVAVVYALISVHKALRESEKGRREDFNNYSEKLEKMVDRGNETRERLIRATDMQTQEFKLLAEHVKEKR